MKLRRKTYPLMALLVALALFACDRSNPKPTGPTPSGKAAATQDAPAAPTNLRVEAVTDSSARVLWDAAEGATDYKVIYYPAVGGNWTKLPKGTTLYTTITNLEPNTAYRWGVVAYNNDDRSGWVLGPNFTTLGDDGQVTIPAANVFKASEGVDYTLLVTACYKTGKRTDYWDSEGYYLGKRPEVRMSIEVTALRNLYDVRASGNIGGYTIVAPDRDVLDFIPEGGKRTIHLEDNSNQTTCTYPSIEYKVEGDYGVEVSSSYTDDAGLLRVELSNSEWVKNRLRHFTATLTLEDDVWENEHFSTLSKFFSVVGIKDLSIERKTWEDTVWFCVSGCGGIFELGYWKEETKYANHVIRRNNTVVQFDLRYEGRHSDIDSTAAILFIVRSGAIQDYRGRTLTVSVPVHPTGTGDPPSDVSIIPDANLRAEIAISLGKASATITQDDMATLTSLEAPNKNISDLTGLEFAINLTWLGLWDNAIWDLSPLEGLTNLTELWLNNNAIWDLSPLEGLTNLTELRLNNNAISSISWLLDLTKLTHLDLEDNPLGLVALYWDIPELEGRGVTVWYDSGSGKRIAPDAPSSRPDRMNSPRSERLSRKFAR